MKSFFRITGLLIVLGAIAGCKEQAPAPASTAPAPRISDAPATTQSDAAPTQLPATVAENQDWTLPGNFAADTTLQQLQQRFGKDNVSVQEIDGAEGEVFHGVMLFPHDPTRRATLYFQDGQRLQGLSMINVSDKGSRWKLVSGIGIGTPAAEVRRLNGKPFTFSGFEWDYGGSIIDWQGGTLGNPDAGAALLYLQLSLPQGNLDGKEYPIGDSPFASDDPRWAGLGMQVGQIRVGFPGEDDL